MRFLLPTLLCAVAVGCGDPCADGSMVRSELGLVITEDEHGEGWGRVDCEGCHALPSTHREVCTEEIDGELLREQVSELGYDGCVGCHGDNGVEE